MAFGFDFKREEEVKEYIENLGIEYRFGCFKEKKPQVCHLLGDYLESIKRDFEKAGKVYRSNCLDHNYGKSCLKIGNYTLIGKGLLTGDAEAALPYFEKGCELGDPTSCLHAGLLLAGAGPNFKVKKDIPRGYNYLKKSCDADDDKACQYLSGMYLVGVPRDYKNFNPHKPEENKNVDFLIKPNPKEAFKFALKACECGNIYACANVSMMYNKGDGVEKNPELAEKYKTITLELQKASELTKELKFQQGLENK
ncbi:Cytochrome c oxidase assembly factor 7 homolog [Eumeta japonica]|uniref:Cytochrome c oxidase assembly factor 7 homolog n=1 Tax=Eumeta variegata TaxID=151549 RepID=A0A4C1VZI2_EUMVA|nr:Cytochrome c oxidase assembly factor 7 homolog [Eumeta japonica]